MTRHADRPEGAEQPDGAEDVVATTCDPEPNAWPTVVFGFARLAMPRPGPPQVLETSMYPVREVGGDDE